MLTWMSEFIPLPKSHKMCHCTKFYMDEIKHTTYHENKASTRMHIRCF